MTKTTIRPPQFDQNASEPREIQMNFKTSSHVRRRTKSRILVGGVGIIAIGGLVALASPNTATLAQDEVPESPSSPGRIVYTRQDSEDALAYDMFTSRPDGANEVRLSDIDESLAGEHQPRWSPDGSRVVFATGDKSNGLASYWTIGHEGGEPVKVVAADGKGKDPAWSPDGRCFAYSGAHDGDDKRTDIKTWCEGEGVTVITNTPDVDERDPDWSPDGSRILYVARDADSRDERTERWSMYTVGIDGADSTLILDWWGSHERVPRYSPDGTKIAFMVSDNVDYAFGTLHVFTPITGEVEWIIRKPAGPVTWSPDGREVMFSNVDDTGLTLPGGWLSLVSEHVSGALNIVAEQHKGLYRYDLVGRNVTRLTGNAGGREKDDYEYGYAPDWTIGTITPTPLATATFTPSPTPVVTDTPTATATPEFTVTPSNTATPEGFPWPIYLAYAESDRG